MKKSLLFMLSIACTTNVYWGGDSIAATMIQKQSDITTQFNDLLKTKDVVHTTTNVSAQIFPSEDITIQGNANEKHSLTLKSIRTKTSTTSWNFDNIFLSKNQLQISDLKNLNLDTTNAYSDKYGADNIYLRGGILILNNSVEELNAKNATKGYMNPNANIRVDSGIVKIFSPTINLEQGSATSIRFNANTQVYLGDSTTKINSLNITNSTFDTAPINYKNNINAIRGINKGNLTINADNISIKNQGKAINLTSGAVANIGLPDSPVSSLTVNNVLEGLVVNPTSQLNINANNIEINYHNIPNQRNGHGIAFENGGQINITNGTEDSPGNIIIQGTKDDKTARTFHSSIYGDSRQTNYSPINLNIKNGNLNLNGAQHGIFLVNTHTDNTANYVFDLHSLNIENTTEAIHNHNGNMSIQAKNKINITSQVGNYGGNLNIKTTDNTITTINGRIVTTVDAGTYPPNTIINPVTEIDFNGNESYFAGYARNVLKGDTFQALTTLNFSNGATWHGIRQGLADARISEDINLNLDNAKVIIRTEDPNYDKSDSNQINPALQAFFPPYNILELRNLNSNAFQEKNGTFVFRTNLEANHAAKNLGTYDAETNTWKGQNDLIRILGSESHGKHKIEIIDQSKNKPEHGLALLIQDLSENPEATFEGSVNLNTGGLFINKAIITTEVPEKYNDYKNIPTTGKNWYLALIDEEKLPTPEPNPEVPPTPTDPTSPLDPPNTDDNQQDNGNLQPDNTPPDTTPEGDNTQSDNSSNPNESRPIAINGQIHIDFAKSAYIWHNFMQDNLFQRQGSLTNFKSKGIWAKLTHGEHSDKTLSNKVNYANLQIGYQSSPKERKNYLLFSGFDYKFIEGSGSFNKTKSTEELTGHVLNYTSTRIYNNGHYLDLVGKLGRLSHELEYKGDFNDNTKYSSWYYGLSGEWGHQKELSNGKYIVPQIQLSYGRISKASYHSNNDITGDLEPINSLVLRSGLILGKQYQNINLYAKMFVNHEFLGTIKAKFKDNSDHLEISHNNQGTWYSFGLGYEYHKDAFNKSYLSIYKDFGRNKNHAWQFNFSISHNF